MRLTAATIALLSTGCDQAGPPSARAAEPKIDLVSFFTGTSQGQGEIDIVFQSPQSLRVASVGRADGHGGIIVDQAIKEGAKSPRTRRWRMRCSDNRCGGTLTDASGPVVVRLSGNTAHVRYTMHNGFAVEQWLVLQSGRRTIDNRLQVSKWGLPVARIDETIVKRP